MQNFGLSVSLIARSMKSAVQTTDLKNSFTPAIDSLMLYIRNFFLIPRIASRKAIGVSHVMALSAIDFCRLI